MLKRFIDILFSIRLASCLIVLFAFVIGFATFIENDFGRMSAKSLIFNTWWFELILVLLAINLIINMKRYNLFRKEKLAVLMFHLAFVFIILGAGVTRYFGFEGMMHIREGKTSNTIISDDVFLQIKVDDREMQYEYNKRLFLSGITNNSFSVPVNFLDYNIDIVYKNFLPNVDDTLVLDSLGVNILHLVVPGPNGMQTEYLSDKEQRKISTHIFTFNNPLEGAINIFSNLDQLICESPSDISSMKMIDQSVVDYESDSAFPLERRVLYSTKELNFVLKDIIDNGNKKLISSSNRMTDGNVDALIIDVKCNGEEKEVVLFGGKGFTTNRESFKLGNLYFNLSYGSMDYHIPFQIKLRDFQLERYPGSMSPSSFAAEITVLDNQENFDYRIFMNNVLDYKGYRFFQSSYDKDEKGTILSVNHDRWGTLISYLGYLLLALGIISVLFFSKSTRFALLANKLKLLKKKLVILLIPLLSSFMLVQANTDSVLVEAIPITHTNLFEELLIQDNGGRIKPINTLCSEFLRKISRRTTINNQNSSQVILGMMCNPKGWSRIPLIKVSNNKLKDILNIEDNHASFKDFFQKDGSYKLREEVDRAYATPPIQRDKFIKDIITVDERVNLSFSIFNGGFLRLFPLEGDSNNTWYTYSQHALFSSKDSLFVANIIPIYLSSISDAKITNSWSSSDSLLVYISKFQDMYSRNLKPPNYKVTMEILYNKLDIFSNLFKYYLFLGILLLVILFFQIFNSNNKALDYLISSLTFLILFGFFLQTSGLIVRWIISGHAPWSNGYESMIYIAWATMLAGIIFSKRSYFTLSATSIVSALLLMVAHLNWLDPSITNLVPVLNSYWLMIHVAIITASYGFLSLGALLGVLCLWIIIFTSSKNKEKLKNVLYELTYINERTLIIGLFMLAIGTFLGGVWANESWGRYWGWDPKETWALVSVLVYVFVLHLRLIPKLSSIFYFNFTAMSAIKVIIMTYFGVNYYLSGLHSYAAGDPMPIPSFLYYLIGFFIISTVLSSIRFNKLYEKVNITSLILLFLVLYPELFLILKIIIQ